MTPDQALTDEALGALLRRASLALPDAPAPLVQAALALWPQAAASAVPAQPVAGPSMGDRVRGGLAGALAGLQHVLAELQFDSWAVTPLAAGMRGTGTAPRQLLFSAEGRDIDLRIAPGMGGVFSIDGQLLGPDAQCAVALSATAGSQPSHQAEVDTLGEFHFQGIEAGRWHLSLTLPGQVIDLPSIELGGRPA